MTYKPAYKIDKQKPLPVKDTADFGFVFKSEISAWQRKRTMTQEARLEAKKKRDECKITQEFI